MKLKKAIYNNSLSLFSEDDITFFKTLDECPRIQVYIIRPFSVEVSIFKSRSHTIDLMVVMRSGEIYFIDECSGWKRAFKELKERGRCIRDSIKNTYGVNSEYICAPMGILIEFFSQDKITSINTIMTKSEIKRYSL